MKKLFAFACLSLMFAVPAFAGARQNGTVSCSEEAKGNGLRGEERKQFMRRIDATHAWKSDARKIQTPGGLWIVAAS